MLRLLTFALLVSIAGCQMPNESTYLAILNATIWTGDAEQPMAQSILIQGDRIVAVGSNDAIQGQLPDNARQIDASGQFVLPGFIDAHVHFIEGGFRLAAVQLRDANTPEVFAQRIADYAETVEPGTWITGGDWDHENWGGELPHREWIDALTPEHPVWVSRLDGHMALANSLALELAGVDASTEDVFGGTIERDEDGQPTGVLKDNAMGLVQQAEPAPTTTQLDRALDAAMAYVNAQGVTSVHHMGFMDQLDVFGRGLTQDRLTTRIYAATPIAQWENLAEYIQQNGRGNEWLKWGALKGFVDGSLGSHTAAFIEPFTDAPDDRGLYVNEPEALYEWIAGADEAGLHLIIHAIGDEANQTLLNLYEQVAEAHGPRDRRFRIEHAQHLAPQDIARFNELGVIASMQPYHAIDDGRWATRVIGPERIKTTYAFKSLLDEGAHVAFGSDWFVAPPTPLEGIYAAVTRRTLDDANPDGWVPEQKITVEQALHAYTAGGAYASFDEQEKGMLKAGMFADLTVINQNLLEIPPESIRDAQVVMTIVGGKIVYDAQEL